MKRLHAAAITASLGLLVVTSACDDGNEGRPVQTDADQEEDVDFEDDYVDGEEPPTVVFMGGTWEAQGHYTSHLPTGCWMDIFTGKLPNDWQRSYVNASYYCGLVQLRVGYVDSYGRQRSTVSQATSASEHWMNEVLIDSPAWQYVNYVRACLPEHGWQCRAIYR